jgi:hypothetical protein
MSTIAGVCYWSDVGPRALYWVLLLVYVGQHTLILGITDGGGGGAFSNGPFFSIGDMYFDATMKMSAGGRAC